MEAKHTATPWHLVDNDMYFEIVVPWKSSPENIDRYCPNICSVSYEDNDGIVGKPNAEFIVRACNAHDELVKALRAYVIAHEYLPDDAEPTEADIQRYNAARSALAKVAP